MIQPGRDNALFRNGYTFRYTYFPPIWEFEEMVLNFFSRFDKFYKLSTGWQPKLGHPIHFCRPSPRSLKNGDARQKLFFAYIFENIFFEKDVR